MSKSGCMGPSELEIMKLLWAQKGKPMTSTEIRTKLEPKFNWNKSTVLTLIRRLVEKGAIVCDKKEVFYYSPMVGEEEYQKYQVTNFVNRIFNGNVQKLISALCHTDTLNQKDINDLRKYFDDEVRRK
jgi:Predicted transcriptional regulator